MWGKDAINVQCHVAEAGGEGGRGFGKGISCRKVYVVWDRRDGEDMLEQGDTCVLLGRGSGRGWKRVMGMVGMEVRCVLKIGPLGWRGRGKRGWSRIGSVGWWYMQGRVSGCVWSIGGEERC